MEAEINVEYLYEACFKVVLKVQVNSTNFFSSSSFAVSNIMVTYFPKCIAIVSIGPV